MKTTTFFVAFLLCATILSAQISPETPWTWMKGDNTIDQSGVYGTKGVAAATNKPGARNSSATWRDNQGSLWLFGGEGYGSTGFGYLNDLWKYIPSTNQWTWVKGDNTNEQHSTYGTQGVPHTNNKPGAIYSSVSWTTPDGSLWLFGGYGYTDNNFGFLNSLWKYNPSTNQWTWVKGNKTIDEPAVYGAKGVESITNKPGARYGSQTWVDTSGNLWLYGGFGFTTSANGILNDIWKYNPTTNSWTWIKGDNVINKVGVYGTRGVSSAGNIPGGRYVSTSWTDNSGNFWMFGGYGFGETSAGRLSDVWKYNMYTNEWTWTSGDKTINQPGVYGSRGVSSTTNKPGARYISSSWRDAGGNLWMFGGAGYDMAGNLGQLNDLWKYNPVSSEWTWVKGDNTIDHVGIYGTQGMADSTNKSGARTGSVSWTDGNGNLWLFGGYGFDGNTSGILNDLWKISSLWGILPLKLIEFSGAANNDIVNLKWLSEQETNFNHFNVQRSVDGINFITIGKTDGSGNTSRNNYTYIDNEIKNIHAAKAFYRLQLVDKNGSVTYSKILTFNFNKSFTSITTFPNPAVQSLNISFTNKKAGTISLSINDMKGVVVKKQTENIDTGRASICLDVNNLASGTYIVFLTNADGIVAQQKFIKQ